MPAFKKRIKENIFAVTILAQRFDHNAPNIESRLTLLKLPTEDDAVTQARAYALALFPEDQGWKDHHITVLPVPFRLFIDPHYFLELSDRVAE